MAQTTLTTTRLTLVPLSLDHIEHVLRLDSDPEVVRFVENGRPLSSAEATAAHRRRLSAAKRAVGLGLGHWAGFLRDESGAHGPSDVGPFVGRWCLAPIDDPDGAVPLPKQAKLGYRLLPAFWRQGLATEGARELVRHGFASLGLGRISAETMAVNVASRATLAAAGLHYVRTFHPSFADPIPGTEEGEVEYALTREDWLALGNAGI